MKNLPKHFKGAHPSLFQSAIREVGIGLDDVEKSARGLFRDHEAQNAASHVLCGKPPEEGTLEVCASLAFQLVEAKIEGDQQKIEDLENQLKFSPCDAVGWLKVVEVYLKYYHGGAEPMYRTYQEDKIDDSFVYPLPGNNLTVGVIGDWGTGEEVADVVLEEVFKHKPDVLIHVGDIYYAGTPDEAQTNFMDPVNKARSLAAANNIPVYNLPGNHDYYSGGQGFYNTIDQLNLPPAVPEGTPVQEASFFCLRNDHWQLQGLDTGFYDHDLFKVNKDTTHLHPSEIAWHQNKLASAGDRKVIFFSHHQLFSSFLAINGGTYNPDLYDPFKSEIESGKIAAWLWGHEHLMEIYGPHLGLKAGRCVGNGAFPELISETGYKTLDESKVGPIPPLLTDPDTGTFYKTCFTEKVFNHGYAILNLNNAEATADYYQVPGDGVDHTSTLLFHETLG